jgi:hypothetical protein
MIVNSKENHIVSVPAGRDGDLLIIVPGTQEFPNEAWAKARPSIIDKIKGGTLEEMFTKAVDGKDPTGKPTKGAEVVDFKDLKDSEQISVLEACNNIKQLETWKATNFTKEAALVVLVNRINKLMDRSKDK